MTGAKTQFARKGAWPSTVNDLDDDDLKADAQNTKYWTVTTSTSLGSEADQSITLNVNTNSYSYTGTITLDDGSWSGTGDFADVAP
jgi:hypothetical protein